jgi:hypothetical protein
MLSLLLQLSICAHAEKSAFEQQLEKNQMVMTEERTVIVNGKPYHEVQFDGKSYYLHAIGPQGEMTAIDCQLNGPVLPHLDEIGVKVRRAKVFVNILKETCETKGGQTRHSATLDPRIGVELPSEPKDKIKKKKIYLGPWGSGFSGEW